MAANVDPTKHRVLLVGPRVVHLRPFFEKRHYPVVAAGKGVEGMAQLDTSSCSIVILELNLGDLTATEFLMAARQGHPRATFLLLDESTKAGQIVKALQAGLDGYLATPPDEDRLFYEVERHLLRSAEPGESLDASTVSMTVSTGISEESGPSGFEDGSTQTAMQSMTEATLHIALADREGQVQELEEQLKIATEAARPLRETIKRFEEAHQSLAGVLDGPLDAESGQRLREQVQLAQVASIEIDSLRLESNAGREARTRLQAELDDVLRRLRQATNNAPEDKTARVEELESELMVLEGRVSEANDAAAAAREALALSKDEAEDAEAEAKVLQLEVERTSQRVTDLEAELAAAQIAASSASSASSTAASTSAELTEVLERERESHREALAAVRKNLDDEIARLKDEARGAAERAAAELQSAKDAHAAAEERAAREQARGAEDDIRRSAAEEDAVETAVAEALAAERVAEQQRQTVAVSAAVSAAIEAAEARAAAVVATAVEQERTAAGERERGAVLSAVTDAVSRERERLEILHGKAFEQARAGAADDVDARLASLRAELEGTLHAERTRLADETRRAVDNATDVGFQLEEARMRIEFLEDDAAKVHADADDKIKKAESDFKREKLRLIEEKQAAASGSQEAAVRIERFAAESVLLKKQNAELLAMKAGLEQQAQESAERANAAVAEALGVKESAADAVARAKDASDARMSVDAALGAVQNHARALEEELQQERLRSVDADAALAAASARLAEIQTDLHALLETQAREARERDEAHQRALAERDEAHQLALTASDEAREREGADRAAAVTEREAAHAAGLAARESAHAAELAQRDAAHAHVLADVGGASAQVAELRSEVERLRAGHEVELAAVRSGLEDELSRLRKEAQQVHVQAQEFIAELQARLQRPTDGEGQKAHPPELEPLAAERDQLAALLQAAEQEARSLREQLDVALQVGAAAPPEPAGHPASGPHGPSAEEAAVLKARIAELEASSSSAEPAVLATVRSLVEAIEPLRWGLGSAIDYMFPFESNDQALATHVRNLRLLQATLTRLAAESGKPQMPQ